MFIDRPLFSLRRRPDLRRRRVGTLPLFLWDICWGIVSGLVSLPAETKIGAKLTVYEIQKNRFARAGNL